MIPLEELTPKAKIEAMQYGHSYIASLPEVMSWIEELTPYIDKDNESFILNPLGSNYVLEVIRKAKFK